MSTLSSHKSLSILFFRLPRLMQPPQTTTSLCYVATGVLLISHISHRRLLQAVNRTSVNISSTQRMWHSEPPVSCLPDVSIKNYLTDPEQHWYGLLSKKRERGKELGSHLGMLGLTCMWLRRQSSSDWQVIQLSGSKKKLKTNITSINSILPSEPPFLNHLHSSPNGLLRALGLISA